MKILSISAVALLSFSLLSCSPSKEKIKASFVKSCMQEVESQTVPKMKEMMKDYCECSGEKMVNKFSASEIKAMDKMSQSEMRAKLMPVIQDCIDELKQKAEQYQQSQVPAQ